MTARAPRIGPLALLLMEQATKQEDHDHRVLESVLVEMHRQGADLEWPDILRIVAATIRDEALIMAARMTIVFDMAEPADIIGGAS